MPKSWIPFRGDSYSKENSKKYIPKSISEYTRIFGTIVLIGGSILAVFAIIFDALNSKSSKSIFALVIIATLALIAIAAFMDARKINSKKK